MKNQSAGSVSAAAMGWTGNRNASATRSDSPQRSSRKTSAARNPTFIPEIAKRWVNPERRKVS
jgi:hypothetical protein